MPNHARNMLFISHANPQDNEVARWLALRLAAEGYPVWCALTKLLGGEPFWKEIETAIRERTCKFLFLLSQHSNEKQGTLDELNLATTVRKQVGDERFIIPLRVDDMDFSKANIRIHGLNIVDFTSSWILGFQRLVERLRDDAVQTDLRFGKDAVAQWWTQTYGQNEGVAEQEDCYLTNQFPVVQLPDKVRIIGLQAQPKADLNPSDSPHPVAAHKRFLISFAEPRELLPFIERNKLHFEEGMEEFPLQEFLGTGWEPTITRNTARNLIRYLFRQAMERFALSRGLCRYDLASRRTFFWFSNGLLEGDKLSFQTPDGRSIRRHLVGFSNCTARDGSVITRNWHFGVELDPYISDASHVSVLPHVCLSVEGVPFDNPKKQHRLRRSQCRRWYNDDWRDRILASMFHLSGGKSELIVPLSPSANFSLSWFPEALTSPVTYQRVEEEGPDEEPPETDYEDADDDEEEDDDE